jgi:hypothetical protein
MPANGRWDLIQHLKVKRVYCSTFHYGYGSSETYKKGVAML